MKTNLKCPNNIVGRNGRRLVGLGVVVMGFVVWGSVGKVGRVMLVRVSVAGSSSGSSKSWERLEVAEGIKLRRSGGERGDGKGREQRAASGDKRGGDRSLSRSPFFQGCGLIWVYSSFFPHWIFDFFVKKKIC